MWVFDSEYNRWVSNDDMLTRDNFSSFQQALQDVRFYSKCLSGAVFSPVNDLNDIYDVIGKYEPKNWYVGINGSEYTNTLIPSNAKEINATSSTEYYTKFLGDYGLSLKTLFTPKRLMDDSINYIYVDIATTEKISGIGQKNPNLVIDGIRLKEGHIVLVKDQTDNVVLPSTTIPNEYFVGNYEVVQVLGATVEYKYYTSANGIYIYSDEKLTKTKDLNDYENCRRFSVSVKNGDSNTGKQYHLSRLLNGYYPVSGEPMEFKEKKNWLIRNKVDYNNMFEINYYDVIKHDNQSYNLGGVTYSIPERIISVGEFGIILNTQGGVSNIIKNKYKINLRSITQTSKYYWICGDKGILLKVRKHDFNIEKIELNIDNSSIRLTSISFFNDLRGVVVGDLNTIYLTTDGGSTWNRLRVTDFDAFYFNKVIFSKTEKFWIIGTNGIFIEMIEDITGWTAYRRRISRVVDDEDEYLLVDNINDMIYATASWGLSFSYSTQSTTPDKEMVFLCCDESKLIVFDVNNSIDNFDFIYLDFDKSYGDIVSISKKENSNQLYFTGIDSVTSDSGVFSFNLSDFTHIGVGSSYSNTCLSTTASEYITSYFPNRLFDYKGQELIIAGNESLFFQATYSTSIDFYTPDENFEKRLKSKLLFLDYDMGSKLNFFTDFGDYRLPSEVQFSESSLQNGEVGFKPLIISATFPSFVTQSETNWWTYWSDKEKQFEYYSTAPFSDSTKVLMSNTFSYSPTQSEKLISNITNSLSHIQNLAPSISDKTSSRYNGASGSTPTDPLTNHDLYIYDYLMVQKVDLDYPVNVGDVIRFSSVIVEGNFIVNKILTTGSYKFLYMITNFNDNITTNLNSLTASIINLNTYSNTTEFINRFGLHPMSNAYDSSLVDGDVLIKPKYNYFSAYYNLATNVEVTGNTYTMSYTEGFLNFGYSPTYNLLTYLEGLNDYNNVNPKFTADKEYYALPEYRAIPVSGIGNFESNQAYISYNGITYSSVVPSTSYSTSNKILFGKDIKLIWDSIFINTFVDIHLYDTVDGKWPSVNPTTTTEKALVMKKYYDTLTDSYVIEFNKKIVHEITKPQYWLDIVSRRKLIQISEDLKELNNIQRPIRRKREVTLDGTDLIPNGYDYLTYEPELNFKLNTDSYAKVLLSDVDTRTALSGIMYSDYKGELSLNITKLDEEFKIPIKFTGNYSGKLFIYCSEKHVLKDDDGVVLEFNGGVNSSESLNQNYFGYHTVKIVNEYNFYVNLPYGNDSLTGQDTGFVKYTKTDPFLGFEPVDLIDVGVDKKGKISIELNTDNTQLSFSKYSLTNVDFTKLRYKLVDGLDLETIVLAYPWILEAEISGATIGLSSNQLCWYKGTWECGRWFGGRWISGQWISGDWYDGTWESKTTKDIGLKIEIDEKSSNLSSSTWYNGRWYAGEWKNGTWVNGRWYDGIWDNGKWYKGTWNDGTWNNGDFTGGIWVRGKWNNGFFSCDNGPSYWIDGQWFGGDFENGMWYNGTFDEKNNYSRFGVNAYNSRTATWQSGNWIKGSFYSRLNINDNDEADVSDIHKYSIWKTGNWFSGDFYGGVVYNINWKNGTWYGGILEDIEVIGLGNDGVGKNYFTLNGIFKFNTGDTFTIIDNNFNQDYSIYGSNNSPKKYTVLDTLEIENKWTKIYVASIVSDVDGAPDDTEIDTTLRVVSRFTNCNWKSGVWTNGIYENGLWEGGIWYNGIFEATWM